MPLRNLIVAFILSIVVLAAVVGEGYLYSYSQQENASAERVAQSIQTALNIKQPIDALAQVRSDLAAQTERLDQMQASFPDSPSLDASIKANVVAAAAVAAKANTLAADPKLGVSTQPNVIALGQKATAALAYLQSLSKTPASTVALNDAALNAVELVAAYAKELSSYVNSLTPDDSGLSAGEIASYVEQTSSIVSDVSTTEDSLAKIDSIPASAAQESPVLIASNPATSLANSQTVPDAALSSSDQGQVSVQAPNQAGSSVNGQVTLGDIVDQENVVAQTANEADQLAGQAAVENSPASNSADASSSGSSDDSSQPGNDSGNSVDTGASGGDNSGSPIQTNDGPVKLIQGENTF